MMSRCVRVVPIALVLTAGALGGCTATADVSYGEYQFGPGYEAERVYERRVYADTDRGFGSEECRGVARRGVDPYGNMVVTDMQVCDEAVPDPVF
ncbi:hypothetical protein ACFOYU_14060 [Microvirga sp. GCM10011540]|uniref:hypothetical protein n=1 Tax=Microvirga sp. GCM10011540 TaxID=3317338 RepID=UPI003611E8E9